MHYYLVDNINRDEPQIVKESLYIRIKGKADGSQTAIISFDPIVGLTDLTKEELQVILDQWIDDENINPETDIYGNLLIQSKINLGQYDTEDV